MESTLNSKSKSEGVKGFLTHSPVLRRCLTVFRMESIVLIEFQEETPCLNANFAVYDSVFLIDLKCESALEAHH